MWGSQSAIEVKRKKKGQKKLRDCHKVLPLVEQFYMVIVMYIRLLSFNFEGGKLWIKNKLKYPFELKYSSQVPKWPMKFNIIYGFSMLYLLWVMPLIKKKCPKKILGMTEWCWGNECLQDVTSKINL